MGNYATAADVRAEGVPQSTTDAKINSRIAKWEAVIEKLTGQVFRIVEPGELTFNGSNARILHFNLPLVEVTSLYVNDETTALEATEYRAHVGRAAPQDDRQNPKIVLTGNRTQSIYTRSHGCFLKGLDQKITAKWGYVEPDDSTPPLIKDAVVQLTVLDLDGYFDQKGSSAPVTPVRREKTDDHEIEYQQTEMARMSWGMLPKDIADQVAMFRGPIKINSPDPRWYGGYYYHPASEIVAY